MKNNKIKMSITKKIINSINNSKNKTIWGYYNPRHEKSSQREWDATLLNEIIKIATKNEYDCIISSVEEMNAISCSPLYEHRNEKLIKEFGENLKIGAINKEINVYMNPSLLPIVILFNECDLKDDNNIFECDIIIIKKIPVTEEDGY